MEIVPAPLIDKQAVEFDGCYSSWDPVGFHAGYAGILRITRGSHGVPWEPLHSPWKTRGIPCDTVASRGNPGKHAKGYHRSCFWVVRNVQSRNKTNNVLHSTYIYHTLTRATDFPPGSQQRAVIRMAHTPKASKGLLRVGNRLISRKIG